MRCKVDSLVLALALIVLGTIVVALPDSDRRLFSISRGHGPSLLDGVGTALLLAGWAMALLFAWRQRWRVRRRLGAGGLLLAAAVSAAGLALVFWSVVGDHAAWWIAGIALAVAPQAVVVLAAR